MDTPIDPKTLRMSLTGALHLRDLLCESMGCRQVFVINIPGVIDGVNEAELFVKSLRKSAHPNSTNGRIAQQIEDQLPKPPKPDEPTKLGAVALDASGDAYVRVSLQAKRPWYHTRTGNRLGWVEMDDEPLTVVDEGVEP